MKTILSVVLLFALSFNQTQANATNTAHFLVLDSGIFQLVANGVSKTDPVEIKVVVSQKRIWLVADEMPVKCLKTIIKNAEGKVVLEKCFSSKSVEWFLNIESLPKGEYTLCLGANRVEKFKK